MCPDTNSLVALRSHLAHPCFMSVGFLNSAHVRARLVTTGKRFKAENWVSGSHKDGSK